MSFLQVDAEGVPVEAKADEDQNAYETEGEGNDDAKLTGGALGFDGGGESPLTEKIPDADAQMEGGGEDADGGESKKIRIHEEVLNFVVSRAAVGEPTLSVKMPGDVDEGDEAGVALGGVEPVPYPGVGGDVGLAAYPYIDAVAGVIEHGEEDEGPFDEGAEGDSLEIRRNLIVFEAGDEDGAVGPEMFGEECANRNNSGKRMKFS